MAFFMRFLGLIMKEVTTMVATSQRIGNCSSYELNRYKIEDLY